MQKTVEIYTDGSCLGNPGPGGYGIFMIYDAHEKKLSQGYKLTTNNRMEMLAAFLALEAIKRPVRAIIHTDSTYLRDGITKWIYAWKDRGWKTAAKKSVKNVDLWQRLAAAMAPEAGKMVSETGERGTSASPEQPQRRRGG